MSQKPGNINKAFLIWVVANILGFVALGVLVSILPVLMTIRSALVSTLIISIPIGLAQWLALRHICQTSILWVFSITVGMLLALFLFIYIPERFGQYVYDESAAVLIAGYLLMGFMIGLPQWLILRRQFANSSLWLLGSALGVSLGFGIVLTTDLINQSGFISIIIAVLVYVIVTGFILSRLLANHIRSQANVISAS